MNGQRSSFSTSYQDMLELRPSQGQSRKPASPVTAASRSRPGSRSRRGMLSNLGMAVGYLGLVMILSAAPFVHEVLGDRHGHYLACTDFGGSR